MGDQDRRSLERLDDILRTAKEERTAKRASQAKRDQGKAIGGRMSL